jgi:ribosomal protein S18 acetylase RimI-like enzyme
VLNSIPKGTKVWLFENAAEEIVGFGSLGLARWRWPIPEGEYANILLIPMLGLDSRFQGQPPDPEWRFVRQIMSHLIVTAIEMARGAKSASDKLRDWLVLTVHRENRRAIRLYEKCGFELIPDAVRHRDHAVMKLGLGDCGT